MKTAHQTGWRSITERRLCAGAAARAGRRYARCPRL